MTSAISDEASLADCLDELNRCIRWERHHQNEYDEWVQENPAGNTRILAIVAYWRERRARLEARLTELNELHRS
jgi:hypothetical protein